ncbi:hypothetical protein [Nocardioides nanhaiensis]|uniref:Tat pathway signal sequence domain protein n=1 Tax=Nocardioides nanhaiensis TaxID=1476871 RepID=A0ABP8VPZ9_9ACTN
MTQIADASPQEVPQEADAPRGRPREWWWRIAGVLALAAVLGGGWWWTASEAASNEVLIRFAGDRACRGTEVLPAAPDPDGSDEWLPARIVAREGMQCTVTVEVVNGSERTLTLQHADASFVGQDTGTVVAMRPEMTSPGEEPTTGPGPDDTSGFQLDVRIDLLDQVVEPGATRTFAIELEHHPEGCSGGGGGTFSVRGWPRVTYSVLGRSLTRPAADTFAFRQQGPTPGCRRM